MQRFFVTFPIGIDVELVDKDIINQITRVLRMKEGDLVVLFDGDGSETEYELVRILKKSIFLRGKGRVFPKTEPTTLITLFQALPNKHEKIEYIIQKGVEVGIRKFVFFRSDRSQKLIISTAKEERFHAIAREALEQCGGVVMPEIEFVEAFPSFSQKEQHVVLDTIGKRSRISEFRDTQDIGLWVGPEGGWSDEEREEMKRYGFIFAHFSERVLRTETAGVVTVFSLINQ